VLSIWLAYGINGQERSEALMRLVLLAVLGYST
jgi:hypothetical protein